MSPEEKIYFLRDELHHHNHLYYVKNEPVISDYEFDLKLNQLISLENEYPQFSRPVVLSRRSLGQYVHLSGR